MRFTTCPQCGGKTKQRKLPLVIHIDPAQLTALNKTCRYCPYCDLLVAHKDEIEGFLAAFLGREQTEITSDEYLVLGTEDRADWLRGMRTPIYPSETFECLHDFKDVVRFEPAQRWVWDPASPRSPGSTRSRRAKQSPASAGEPMVKGPEDREPST